MNSSLCNTVFKLLRCGVVAAVIAIFVLSLAVCAGPPATSSDGMTDEAVLADQEPLSDIDGDDGFTGQLLIFLAPGTDPVAFGNANGMTYLDTLKSDKDAHVYLVGSQGATTTAMITMSASPAVRQVFENRRSFNRPCGFVPNDPYFHKNTPVGFAGPGNWGQWHLKNEWVAGRDINITPAWDKWMTGYGVNMAVVDDCLQKTHPDLAPNYLSADSWDFHDGDADPSPALSGDRHGVSTAGVAAARGGNGIGVTGVAPYSRIAGLRVSFGDDQTDAMFVDATLYHSSGTNTSIKVKNHSYGTSQIYLEQTAQVSALATSTAAGTIHVFSAGNDRGYASQDSNTKMKQASPKVISVAALGSNGIYSNYSCFGANVFCTAPSISDGYYGITTTDRTGTYGYNGTGDLFPDESYTSQFGGTSSSAPTVAGAITVTKQVQPALNTRLAKHLLARTCKVVDATDSTATSDGGWKTNAAGFQFNQNYGFGLIDTDALCYQARRYKGVSSQYVSTTALTTVGESIPDNNSYGVTRTFSITSTTSLEEVVVYLDINHTSRGQIEAFLTSPGGTTSRLMRRSADTGDNIRWSFTTNAFWGENPSGTWYLRVVDTSSATTGTWNRYKVTLNMGYPLLDVSKPNVTINQLPTQADPSEGPYIYYKVLFDDWVTDFTSGDVALSGTARPTTAVVTAGYGREYTVRVSGMKPRGTVMATIPAGVVHDARGYSNNASTSTDNTVTFNVTPKNLYISPNTGSLTPGYKTISSAHSDYNGGTDIYKAYMMIDETLSGATAAYVQYDRSLNKVYLRNDAGTSWGTGYAPGTSIALQNSQCYLNVAETTVTTSGDILLVKWRIYLKSPFSGLALKGYLFTIDYGGRSKGWDLMGNY